jgi:hypothetical protein
MMCKKIILIIFALALVSTAYGDAPTVPTKTWDGQVDNQWVVGDNWEPNGVPTNVNGVIIDDSPDYNSIDMTIAITIGAGQNAVCDTLHGPGHESPAEVGGGSLSIAGTLTCGDWNPTWTVEANTVNLIDMFGDAVVTNTGAFDAGDNLGTEDPAANYWFTNRRVLNVNVRENATWNCAELKPTRTRVNLTVSDNAELTVDEDFRPLGTNGDCIWITEDNATVNAMSIGLGGNGVGSRVFMYLNDNATINLAMEDEGTIEVRKKSSGQIYINGGTMTGSGGLYYENRDGGSGIWSVYRQTAGLVSFGGGCDFTTRPVYEGGQQILMLGGELRFGMLYDDHGFNLPAPWITAPNAGTNLLSISGGILNAGYLKFDTGDPNSLTIDVNDRDGGGMWFVGRDANSWTDINDCNLVVGTLAAGNVFRFKYVGPSNEEGVTYLGVTSDVEAWGPWPFDRHRYGAQTRTVNWQVADIIDPTASQKVYYGTDEAALNAIPAGGAGEFATYDSGTSSATLVNLSPLLATFWRVDSNDGGTWTKSDLWQFSEPQGKAEHPDPAHNSTVSDADLTLRWGQSPWPAYLLNQNVYFGTNEAEVTNANTSDVNAFVGNYGPDVNSLNIGQLDLGVQRWWRIDSNMNTPTKDMVKGDVWKFTMQQFYTIEDFDWYQGTTNLRATWLDFYSDGTNGAVVVEMTEPNRYATRSKLMDFDWITSGYSHWDTKRTFDAPFDMTVFDLKALVLYSYGDPCNTSGTPLYSLTGPQKIYVTLSDGPNSVTQPYDGDANNIFVNQWAEWNIALADFSPVALNAVTSIMLSVTDDETGNGHVKFDDIRLYKQRCVPYHSGVTAIDVNADCIIDWRDQDAMRGSWLQSGTAYNFHPTNPLVNCMDYAILANNWQMGDWFPK